MLISYTDFVKMKSLYNVSVIAVQLVGLTQNQGSDDLELVRYMFVIMV